MQSTKNFYGWKLAAVAWLLYGVQTLGFYGWGIYLPSASAELGLTRAQGGIVYGFVTLAGGLVSPLVGMAIGRFGLRFTVATGYILSSIGYFAVGRSQSLLHLILSYGVFVAVTHAFSTIIPTQTLASTWFVRYRSRVLAVLLAASGILSPAIYAFHTWVLEEATWRTGWTLIAVINFVLGLLALAFFRNSPSELGQLPDGAPDQETLDAWTPASQADDNWSAKEAIRTRQFALMVICGFGYAVPFVVINHHGAFHLQDMGFGVKATGSVLAAMVLVSTVGRLLGGLGDFVSPPRLLSLALFLEAVGTLGFLYASTPWYATGAAALIGLGFGMAYISQAATFARFFGRRAFATTTGMRLLIGALFSASMPAFAGWVFDTQGTYAPAFIGFAVLTMAGSAVAFMLRPPVRRPDEAAASA